MGGAEKSPTNEAGIDLTKIDYKTRRNIANYAGLQLEAKQLARALTDTEEAIAAINEGLPPGHMLTTTTQALSGSYSSIFKLDENGPIFFAEMSTLGCDYHFIGDRLIIEDDVTLVVNSELGLAISAGRTVEVENPEEISTRSRIADFQGLLKMIDELQPGDKRQFDCLYY